MEVLGAGTSGMAIGGNFRTSSLEYFGRREASSRRGDLFLGFRRAAQEEIAACQKVAEPAQAAVMAWGAQSWGFGSVGSPWRFPTWLISTEEAGFLLFRSSIRYWFSILVVSTIIFCLPL